MLFETGLDSQLQNINVPFHFSGLVKGDVCLYVFHTVQFQLCLTTSCTKTNCIHQSTKNEPPLKPAKTTKRSVKTQQANDNQNAGKIVNSIAHGQIKPNTTKSFLFAFISLLFIPLTFLLLPSCFLFTVSFTLQ